MPTIGPTNGGARARRVVVIDATPVLGVSGFRGIGRYVFDLLHGLEATRDEWSKTLEIRAVTDLGPAGSAVTDHDLARAAGSVQRRRGTQPDASGRKRRASLGHAARDADLLHFTEVLGTPLRRRIRWVATCHDLIPLRMPEHYVRGGRLQILSRWTEDFLRYQRTDRLVAISRRTRDDLVRLLRVSADRVDVVSTGIDLAHWSPTVRPDDEARRRALAVGGRPYLLFVGQGDARKGVPAMLRVIAEVRPVLDLELVWAAKLSQAQRSTVVADARALGVEDRVRFVGFAEDDDLAALYRGALAHIFMSKLEGFGLSVAESLASGCPAIVVRGSGADEVAGDAGLVVAPDDFAAAADAVLRLAARPDLRAERVAAGLDRTPRFDRRAMARGYVASWMTALRAR